MANRNRLSGGGGYQNRRQDGFSDYNRGFSRDGYGGGRPQGGGGFGGVNPWHTGPPAPPQAGPLPLQASTETTIALASNLINNLLQSRNSVPSLLDINVRRDFGGYGQGYQAERRGLTRMGGRGPGQLGGGQGGVGGMGGGRRPMQGRRPQRQDQPKPKNQANKQAKVKAEETVAAQSSEPTAEGEVKTEESEAAAGEEAVGADGKPVTGKDVKTSYDGINPVFLVCHICEKKMWDGRSFDNHIKGRAHFVMMEKIRESYKMTADAMRQEQRISEMRKDRRGFQQQRKQVFCAMCDLYVVAEGAHRRSAGHQKLKRYLHPACNTCRQEMPTRIEFEEHRLTPAHMKVLQDKNKDQEPELKTEVMQMSTLQDELALVRPFRNRQRKNRQNKEGGDETATTTGEDGATETAEGGEAIKTEDGAEIQTGEGEVKMEEEPAVEGPPLILDYQEGDDLSEKTRENLPKYLPDRELGVSFITDYTCKQCTLCRKLFDSEETAAVHARTYKHFQSFLRLVHSKGNFKTKQEATKRESPADGEAEGGAEGEEGNCKKRKMDNGEGVEGEEYQNGDEIGDEPTNDPEQNGGDVLNESIDLNEEIDEVLNAVADDVQMENEPAVELHEEEPQTPVPEPAVTPSQKTPQLNTSQQSTPQQKTPQSQTPQSQTPNRRGRGRGRGRGAGRNRI